MNYDTEKYECVSNYDIWSTFWAILMMVIIGSLIGLCVWYFTCSQKKKQQHGQPQIVYNVNGQTAKYPTQVICGAPLVEGQIITMQMQGGKLVRVNN